MQTCILQEDDNQLEEIVITSSKSSTFSSERTGAETSIGSRELKFASDNYEICSRFL